MALEYTPNQKPQPKAPAITYELKKDVTGKPPEKRGPQALKAVKYEKDENGKDKKVEVQFRVPYPPKTNCKKCYGTGHVGFNTKTGDVIPCLKCYPMATQK